VRRIDRAVALLLGLALAGAGVLAGTDTTVIASVSLLVLGVILARLGRRVDVAPIEAEVRVRFARSLRPSGPRAWWANGPDDSAVSIHRRPDPQGPISAIRSATESTTRDG
jgi:hypothetical protein